MPSSADASARKSRRKPLKRLKTGSEAAAGSAERSTIRSPPAAALVVQAFAGAPRKWSIVSKNFTTEIGFDR
jgi:hypothetical protein